MAACWPRCRMAILFVSMRSLVNCNLSVMMAELEASDASPQPDAGQRGCGREYFAVNRDNISNAEQGASYLVWRVSNMTEYKRWNLVADIGGTNARFAALRRGPAGERV